MVKHIWRNVIRHLWLNMVRHRWVNMVRHRWLNMVRHLWRNVASFRLFNGVFAFKVFPGCRTFGVPFCYFRLHAVSPSCPCFVFRCSLPMFLCSVVFPVGVSCFGLSVFLFVYPRVQPLPNCSFFVVVLSMFLCFVLFPVGGSFFFNCRALSVQSFQVVFIFFFLCQCCVRVFSCSRLSDGRCFCCLFPFSVPPVVRFPIPRLSDCRCF